MSREGLALARGSPLRARLGWRVGSRGGGELRVVRPREELGVFPEGCNDRPGAGVVRRKPRRGVPALQKGSEVAPRTLSARLGTNLLLGEAPQARRESLQHTPTPPPAPGMKCCETCRAWSPRPAPGGLAGPGQIVPGEAPGAAGSELRAAGRLGVGGGQGRVPDVGVADPGTLWPLLQRAPGGPPRVAVLVGWELVFQRCNMDTSCSPLLLGPWLPLSLPGR